jgi:hypothetical protein
MSFMIISDHDRVRHGLSHNLIGMVLDGEDDLKPKLFVLVSAIASDAHWKLNLHRSLGKQRWWVGLKSRNTGWRVPRRFGPFFDFICVEDNDTLLLVLLK